MSFATAKALANVLSLGFLPASGTPTDEYVTDIVAERLREPDSPYVVWSELDAVARQNGYGLTPVDNEPLAVAFDGTILASATWEEASLYDLGWSLGIDAGSTVSRRIGTPVVWTQEHADRASLSFYVIPAAAQPATASGTFPEAPITVGCLQVLQTQAPTNPNPHEELYYTLELMAREFARDSDHTDHTFSQTCHNLASLFWNLTALGLDGLLAEDAGDGDTPTKHETESDA